VRVVVRVRPLPETGAATPALGPAPAAAEAARGAATRGVSAAGGGAPETGYVAAVSHGAPGRSGSCGQRRGEGA
jgi:hypothetical protein